MQHDSKQTIKELRVDGGATVNNLLMQFQADILQADVVRPKITETTALGAAYLAGLATGYWHSIDEIESQWQVDRTFSPVMQPCEAGILVSGWHRAVRGTTAWAEDNHS
jgi:glycerol kinase